MPRHSCPTFPPRFPRCLTATGLLSPNPNRLLMKTKFYQIIVGCLAMCFAAAGSVYAQGCVAVKNMTSPGLNFGDGSGSGWQFSLNYRYFRSYKHFRGDHEEKHRVEQGTEVINNDNSVNIGINYTFNNRWSASLALPLMYIDRSSLYEHKRNNSGERYHTQSKGLGDVRITGYFNTKPENHHGHLVVGLGFKLPTGDYNYTDYFQKDDGPTLLPVD